MFGRILIVVALGVVLWAAFARSSDASGPERRYVVQPQDTLWSIASRGYSDPREGVWEIQERNGLGERCSCPGRCSSCRRPSALDWRRGSRRRLPRHGRLDADRSSRSFRHARPPGRREAALRLRRGHAAAAPALGRRPRRAARDLPDPLPRRPLPRPARNAEVVRAPRPRGAADPLRPTGPRRAAALVPRIFGAAELRGERSWSSRQGAVLPRDGYELRTFAVRHGREAIGYALVEDERPGRFDVAAADALGIPFGPERGSLQARQARDAPRRPRRDAGAGARRGATRPEARAHGRHGALRRVVEAALGADLLVHEATFCEEEAERARETEHSTALEAARVARDAGVKLLALTHLSSRYGGRRRRARGSDRVPRHGGARDFDLIEIPFEERGGPELVKSGARLPRAEVPSSA